MNLLQEISEEIFNVSIQNLCVYDMLILLVPAELPGPIQKIKREEMTQQMSELEVPNIHHHHACTFKH